MDSPVLFDTLTTTGGQRIGVATLNAEKSLNALTHSMITLLSVQLARWRQDPLICCILLRGAGDKAFCAGGDVRALRAALLEDARHPNPQAQTFFADEYRLDYAIHTYPKPVIVWGSGIVMGGGLGLMAGASHRIATDSTRIAMPETSIGLYPDVGGSWFLQRMPARLGLFLGLTGAAINAHDALIANLADCVLGRDSYPQLLSALQAATWEGDDDFATVSALLDTLEDDCPQALPPSPVAPRLIAIHQLMNRGSLAKVAEALLLAHGGTDPWLASAAASFTAACPVSAAVTWEIFRRARHLSLAEVLRMELTLSVNFCTRPDFREGVRALLVDKDRQAAWSVKHIADMDARTVASHFISPWTAENHPLAEL
ncbi:enoyl-CoA hydratase/isomerase family protein [Craterilacuibacter sp.]|uniref:enoyl-CoA hydratase/isomerase family protein n=1 Tax=Craterilacuibacter sp. TaxID=2870909 RepID=UPI003F2FA441